MAIIGAVGVPPGRHFQGAPHGRFPPRGRSTICHGVGRRGIRSKPRVPQVLSRRVPGPRDKRYAVPRCPADRHNPDRGGVAQPVDPLRVAGDERRGGLVPRLV
jgi:hypothetical protein